MVSKVITFRVVSFTATLLAARVWFGDWHVSGFQVFLLAYCSAIHYGFEKSWEALAVTPSDTGKEK